MIVLRFLHLLCLISCLCATRFVIADAHNHHAGVSKLGHEETLVAIKEALVAEAQEIESQVLNTAWLDDQGRLHESTVIQSGARIRGIQVKTYIDAMNEPKVEVELDDKRAALPSCFQQDDQLTRTLFISSEITAQQGESTSIELLQKAQQLSRAEFVKKLSNTVEWSVYQPAPSVDPYTKLLVGLADMQTQYQLDLQVMSGTPPLDHVAEAIPGSDPVSIFFYGNPSKFPEQWIEIRALIKRVGRDTPVWQASKSVKVPVRDVHLGHAILPKAFEKALLTTITEWSDELIQYARCEPMHFYLTEGSGNQVILKGGSSSGIQAGDRLLILDESRVPSRILEPGTLAQLSLIEVLEVSTDTSLVARTAGPNIVDLARKVAIPF